MSPVSVVCAVGLLSVLTGMPLAGRQQNDDPCDPGLLGRASGADRYQRRGDRCEGLYAQEISGASLVVASFTAVFDDFDPAALETLQLDWPPPAAAATHLRAVALRPRLYYRMDAIRPAAVGSDRWPMTLVSRLKLSRSELAVVAWSRTATGIGQRDVLLPLRVHVGSHTTPAATYRMVVVPAAELKELHLSVAREDATTPATYLVKDRALGYNYYPAGRGIVISLPKPALAGIYRVELGADLKAGGAATTQAWFSHPAE